MGEPFMAQGPSKAAVLDFNGDGRDDLLLSVDGTTFLYSPTGRQRLTRTDAGVGKMGTDAEPALVGDLNGDGSVDLVGKGASTLQDAALGAGNVSGLLTDVTTGLGAHIQLKYGPRTLVGGQIVRTYQPVDCGALGSQEVACITQLPPLVSEYVEEDLPASRQGRRFVLSYGGAKKGLPGHGFYGFASRQITVVGDQGEVSGSTTLRFYNDDQTRAGMLFEKSVRSAVVAATAASRGYFADTITSSLVDIGFSAAGRPFPRVTGGLTIFNEVFPEIAQEELGRRDWTSQINDFGDVESIVERETVRGVIVEETTKDIDYYANDTDAWVVGLPKDITTASTRSGETLIRKLHYDYYANGLLENVIKDAGTAAANPDIYLRTTYVRQQPYWNVERVVSSPLNSILQLSDLNESR